PVLAGRAPASLDMPEGGHLKVLFLIINLGFGLFHNIRGTAFLISLCHDDNAGGFGSPKRLQRMYHIIDRSLGFRYHHQFRASAHCTLHGNIATVPAHDFDEKYSVMGSSRIPDLIDCFQCGIECCVKTDGIVGAINIIVDGTRATNDGNAEFLTEDLRTSKGSVSTYGHQSLNAML